MYLNKLKVKLAEALYSAVLKLFEALVWLGAQQNAKLNLFLKGRNGWFEAMQNDFIERNSWPSLVWIHAASLGEFEQARPIIEYLKNQAEAPKILLTFYSPSGYEVRKKYPLADFIYYLPLDYYSSMNNMVHLVRPSMIILVKYEIWYNLIKVASEKSIPVYLICAYFHPSHMVFKRWGFWIRRSLSKCKHIFTQDIQSMHMLQELGFCDSTVAGDTRYDRVWQHSQLAQENPLVMNFLGQKQAFIMGSAWMNDLRVAKDILLEEDWRLTYPYKIVIAPHNIDDATLKEMIAFLGENKVCLYTELEHGGDIPDVPILILNTMGMLSSAYKMATIAYVGGAFDQGLHNILEAAVYGLPVIIGPKYDRFVEAKEMIEDGGAFPIHSTDAFNRVFLDLVKDKEVLNQLKINNMRFVQERTGATQIIVQKLVSDTRITTKESIHG